MKRNAILFTLTLAIVSFLQIQPVHAATQAGRWDISKEVLRLHRQAPSIEAFPDVESVVWFSSYLYSLKPDGTMEKIHRTLTLYREDRNPGQLLLHSFPAAGDGSFVISEASWYEPSTGAKTGALGVSEREKNGIKDVLIDFPGDSHGKIIAIESIETSPRRYYLDDVLTLAGESPVWEQFVIVNIPQGMDFYWQGQGVRDPIRETAGGVESITWTVLNQPAWRDNGIVDEKRPTLLFSLQKGLMPYLKHLHDMEASFEAPPTPGSLSSANKNNLSRVGEMIAAHMAAGHIDTGQDIHHYVRQPGLIPPNGPWTTWEQTLIAGKWLERMGWPVTVYWYQQIPVSVDGPNALALWAEPVLVIKQSGNKNIVFKAGQAVEFGKTEPSLYGKTLYRAGTMEIENIQLPKGSASDHIISQNWKLQLDENGVVNGTLELSLTGGWLNVFSLGKKFDSKAIERKILENFVFNVPGLNLALNNVKPLASGYRILFDVKASPGIVGGTDMLLRIPGGTPVPLSQIPSKEDQYDFKFPFIVEQNAVITTPRGYKTVTLPGKTQRGDSKAGIEENFVHWVKKRQLEASSRWTVRSSHIDKSISGSVAEQISLFARWPQLTVPLRKD